MEIRTNHHWRNLEYGYQLSPSERADFDYIDPEEFDSHDFLRYRGEIYDIEEFTASNVSGWDGMRADSFFSAILIRYDGDDMDRVQVGLALS